MNPFSRLVTSLVALVGVSVLSAEPAAAFFDDEVMMMKIANACRIGNGQTEVPEGVRAANLLEVVSKSTDEILAPDAAPRNLIAVPYEYSSPEMNKIYVRGVDFERLEPETLQAVGAMLEAAAAEGISLFVHSGFRDFMVQCRLFNKKVRKELELDPSIENESVAVARVNRRSALPGQSEHQLGTAVDLVTDIPGMGYKLEPEMDRTVAFQWLRANAFRFGFAMSYPRGAGDVREPNWRTGYVYEPWHWRYIGTAYATAFEMCAKQGMPLQEYLRALKTNPRLTCRGMP